MITLRFEGIKEFEDLLASAGRKAPVATRNALNDLAFMIRDAEMETMRRVFKNPMEKTVRNIRVRKASASLPSATIAFNQIWDWDEYMVPEIGGGPRPMKRSEKAFGRYYVPGIGAQLDQYGNMRGSQVQQIMSYLGQFKERGFKMNRTASTTVMRQKGKIDYFKLDEPSHGLAAGVYMRTDKSAGQMIVSRALAMKGRKGSKRAIKFQHRQMLERGVIPVMIFVNRPPTYTKRFPFYEVGQKIMDTHGPAVCKKWISWVMSTAR
jgi:hypothetical protein